MKTLIASVGAIALAVLTTSAMAQPPGGPDGGPGQRFRGPGGPGQRPGGPGFVPPLMNALDADDDGILSSEEIENAAAALKKLDTNGDGQLTSDELRPAGGPGGPGGPRAHGGSRSQGGPGDRPRAGQRRPSRSGDMVERIMGLDKDGDGQVSKEEVPPAMQRMFQRIDTNGDGTISRAEVEAMAERAGSRGGRSGGGRGPAPE